MKRTVAAIALIITVAALCVFENRFTENLCRAKEKKLSACEALYYTDRKLCAEKCEELKKEWKTDAQSASLFINHRHVDEISADMAALPVYALYDGGEFPAACARISRALEKIRLDQKLTPSSFY